MDSKIFPTDKKLPTDKKPVDSFLSVGQLNRLPRLIFNHSKSAPPKLALRYGAGAPDSF